MNTSRWVTRRPHARVAIGESLPLFQTSACRDLAAVYVALLEAEGGRLPPKNRLDVTALGRAVPNLILCAVIKPDRCIYRLAGEEVRVRIGRNPVGLNYYDLVPPERRAHAMRAINMLIDVPCGWRVEMDQSYSSGIGRLVEAVAFPLASAQPGVDGFIVIADCEIGQSRRGAESGVTLLGADIIRRDLIDIGFGIDETFEDLVPAED